MRSGRSGGGRGGDGVGGGVVSGVGSGEGGGERGGEEWSGVGGGWRVEGGGWRVEGGVECGGVVVVVCPSKALDAFVQVHEGRDGRHSAGDAIGCLVHGEPWVDVHDAAGALI